MDFQRFSREKMVRTIWNQNLRWDFNIPEFLKPLCYAIAYFPFCAIFSTPSHVMKKSNGLLNQGCFGFLLFNCHQELELASASNDISQEHRHYGWTDGVCAQIFADLAATVLPFFTCECPP